MQVFLNELQRAAIGSIQQYHMAIRAHAMHDRAADSTHARGEAQRAVAALQRGDLALGHLGGGIAHAGVGVISLRHAVHLGGLNKEGILEYRRDYRAVKSGVIVAHMRADVLRRAVLTVFFSQKSHLKPPQNLDALSSAIHSSLILPRGC